ncbi:MAG: TolC family protein [Bacteroidales bacterium]|nr:TolC family protein [Bacteroidales bacterium]MCF8404676.1 TolC family protein [Bacteroidales bacterium]
MIKLSVKNTKMFIKKFINSGIIIFFKIALFAFLIIGVSAPLKSQEVKKLNLDDAIEIARQQSPDALLAKHKFKRSYWRFRSYKASYLPYLVFDGSIPAYTSGITSGYDQIQGTYFDYYDQNRVRGAFSLNQQIGLTGGSVSINTNLERLDNLLTNGTSYSSSIFDITFNQPIFNFNELKWDRMIQPLEYEEAKKTYLEDMERVSIMATDYFFNLLLAQIKERIAIVNLANYDTLYKIAQGRYNLGKIAENDLLQLELQFLRANAAVKDVELDVENQLFRLKSYLRIKDEEDIELIPPDKIKPFMVEVSKAVAQARMNSSTALSFNRRLIEAESQLAMARYSGRFDANLRASYGYSNTSTNLADINKNPSEARVMILGVSVPILDWGVARGQIKMAESSQEIERTSVEQEQIDFDQEIFLRVARFNMQYDQIVIAAKADTVARKGYEITKARYLIGKISITDLNIAQAESDNSKSSYINTLWNYWRSYYDLRRLTLYDFKNDLRIEVDYRELL